MSAKIKHIIFYPLILGLGILIGWWLNEMYRFADAMRNDIVIPNDTLIFNIDSLRQKEKNYIDSTKSNKHRRVTSDNLNINKDIGLDFDSLIKDSHNQYLLSLSNNEIQICYGRQFDIYVLDYKLFTKQIEEYNDENGNHKVNVYVYQDSFIKEYFNNHPDVNRLDLVCGKILTDKVKLSQGIQIGMEKTMILEKIFKQSEQFYSVDKLTIYEDERGESWTSLLFENDKLSAIIFDSEYDWINKELKK